MRLTVGLALFVCVASASAQIYKWTDSKGVVHYSDTPVAGKATSIKDTPPPPAVALPSLPYELAEAARKHPVTLYTSSGCTACDQGRQLLKQRGVPFVEKTVASDADAAKLKEAGSDGQLPLLLVGRSKLVGFEAGGWTTALNAAAYPRRSMLPRAWRYAVTSAADPVVVPAPVPAEPTEPAPRPKDQPRKQERNDLPPGFQF
jgi:glutaredoxin